MLGRIAGGCVWIWKPRFVAVLQLKRSLNVSGVQPTASRATDNYLSVTSVAWRQVIALPARTPTPASTSHHTHTHNAIPDLSVQSPSSRLETTPPPTTAQRLNDDKSTPTTTRAARATAAAAAASACTATTRPSGPHRHSSREAGGHRESPTDQLSVVTPSFRRPKN